MKGLARKTASVSCEAKRFSVSSPSNLTFTIASVPFINCCIGWVTATSHRGPNIPRAIPRPVSPLKKVVDQIREFRTDHPGVAIEIWFQDEARFGQQGTLIRQWALTGTRPTAWRQTQYEYLYVFETGQTVGLLALYLNTDTVNAFFRLFEQEVDPHVHVFMIWDQAGFHTSQKVKVPANVTIIPLPPYSPQLNPMEMLYWSNRIYEGYDHLRQAANEAWHQVCLDPEKSKSICRAKYVESALI